MCNGLHGNVFDIAHGMFLDLALLNRVAWGLGVVGFNCMGRVAPGWRKARVYGSACRTPPLGGNVVCVAPTRFVGPVAACTHKLVSQGVLEPR